MKQRKGKLKAFIKKHKLLTAVIAIVLIIAIVATGFLIKGKKANEAGYSFIRTTTLAKGTLEDTVSTTGTVKSAKSSNVTTNLNYTVKSIEVAVGDEVLKGDVICTLDTEELESQIEKEESNLAKTKSSAQSSYNSAKNSYNSAKDNYDAYTSTYNEAKSAYNKAKSLYDKAQSSLSKTQSAYDTALSNYNSAGAKYVTALTDYNSALSKYKSSSTSSNKAKLLTAARAYMKAVQNYYGKCTKGSYDISDSSSSASASGMGDNTKNADTNTNTNTSSSVTVSATADDICNGVIASVKNLTGTTLSRPSGTNTLYRLAKKAESLRSAKEICNYSSIESSYTSAKTAYNEAKQTRSQYKNEMSQAKEQLEKAKEELENASTSDNLDDLKSQLEECSLKAEQDGTVTALNATVGSSVSMDNAVATIQDLDNLTVSITIEEADINNVEIGMTCRVTSDASDTALSGTLTQISPVSNEGSFSATVTIDEQSDDIYIGMNASVDIIVSSNEDVYQVPIDAVGDDNGTSFVYRKTGGSGTDMQFEKITVSTGDKNDYYIEISSTELSEGDVVRSSADLSEGIETVSSSSSDSESSGGLFAGLFGGKGGGDMPQGGMPNSGGSSSSSGGFSPPDMQNGPPSNGNSGEKNG